MNIQITWEGDLSHSDAMERRILAEADKLRRVEQRIGAVRIAVRNATGRHRNGDLYAVRLQISTPGGADVVVDRNPDQDHSHEDPYVAIRDAFRAARRRLQDRHRRMQGVVKTHAPRNIAKVSAVFAGRDYGFLETEDGREIYFHRHAVLNGGFDSLKVGDSVRYVESEGEKGPQASSVYPPT